MLEQWEPVCCLILLRDESKRGIFREFWCNMAATKYKMRALPQVFHGPPVSRYFNFDWVFLLSTWHKCTLLVYWLLMYSRAMLAVEWWYSACTHLHIGLEMKCDQDTPTRFYLEIKKYQEQNDDVFERGAIFPREVPSLFLSGSSGLVTTHTDTHSHVLPVAPPLNQEMHFFIFSFQMMNIFLHKYVMFSPHPPPIRH